MKFKRRRSRTPSKYVFYALHLYFSGLSLRKASGMFIVLYQKKSCFNLELDSAAQTHRDMEKEKKSMSSL
jgi:hypothetical protein